MGEVELALKNMLQAEALLLHEGSGVVVGCSGSGGDGDAMLEEDENEVRSEVRVVTGADSDLEEVRNEVRELQGIVQELERRREVYLEELREARRKRSEERSEKESEGQLALQDYTSSRDVDCDVISSGNSCSTHHHGDSSCSSGAHTGPVATEDERDDVLEMRQQKKESADDEMYCSCRMHLTTRVKVIGR
jgi:hypothetical protein